MGTPLLRLCVFASLCASACAEKVCLQGQTGFLGGFVELGHCLTHHLPTGGDIHAHPPPTLFAEHRSFVEAQGGLVDHKAGQLFVAERPGRKVEPHQIGSFRTNGPYRRHLLLQKAQHIVDVALQIDQQLIQPLFSLSIGRFQGQGAENRPLVGV